MMRSKVGAGDMQSTIVLFFFSFYGSAPLPTKQHEGFVYRHVHALDEETYDLLSKFNDCLQFVEEGRQAGGVLVHW